MMLSMIDLCLTMERQLPTMTLCSLDSNGLESHLYQLITISYSEINQQSLTNNQIGKSKEFTWGQIIHRSW